MNRSVLVVGALVLMTTSAGIAQQKRVVTAADYDRAVKMLAPALNGLVVGDTVNPTWLPDGRFWYVRTTLTGTENVVIDPVKKTRETVATPPAGGSPRPRRGAAAAAGEAAGAAAQGAAASTLSKTCGPNVTGTSGPPPPSMSPDGRKAIFVCDWNLWVKDVATGQERQLTTDGVKDFGYATSNAGWATSAAPSLRGRPTGKKIATQQQDERNVGDMYLVETPVNGGHPVLRAWKYPLPGDPVVAMISRVVIDVDTGKIDAPARRRPIFTARCRKTTSTWASTLEPGRIEARLRLDRPVPQELDSPSSPTRRPARCARCSPKPRRRTCRRACSGRFSVDTNEVLWYSQRDNWGAACISTICKTGQAQEPDHHAATARSRGSRASTRRRARCGTRRTAREKGQDPYFTHFYRIGLDGRNDVSLTPDDGTHAMQLSPDGKYVVDTFSKPDVAAGDDAARRRDRRARSCRSRRPTSRSSLATGWKPPMQIKMTAADGKTDIYGMLFRPTNFDPTKKYPIINNAYPGPQSGSVGSRAFTAARGDKQALAELGFVVVSIDGTGTPNRSKAFTRRLLRRDGPPQHDPRSDRRHEGAREEVSVDRHRQGGDVGPLGRRVHHRRRAAARAVQRLLQGRHRRVRQSRPAAVPKTTGASATRGRS